MKIGSHTFNNRLILAPMAGITDKPFRMLCRHFGIELAFSEMVSSNPALQKHRTTRLKTDYIDEPGICAVQILGTDPQQMAEAARLNEQRGAQIIDINMGCPAKKVCSVAAGSALLKDEQKVRQILESVIAAVNVPVTLKIRTGWDKLNNNALNIAHIAEQSGIAALTIHGRSRACYFSGQAEYQTIKRVKQSIHIPVIANGDITSPEKAASVLSDTGADAIMIGRASQGQPWLLSKIQHYLNNKHYADLSVSDIQTIINTHLDSLYHFYGEISGVRIARKHIGWYFDRLGGIPSERKREIYQVKTFAQQIAQINSVFLETDFSLS